MGRAKDTSAINLFVIDNQTRALMSCMEAVELITAGRRVVVAVVDVESGQLIGEERISAAEAKDLNRARGYLRDVARRNGICVHSTVQEALADAVSQIAAARERGSDHMELQMGGSELKREQQAAVKRCDDEASSSYDEAPCGEGADESRPVRRRTRTRKGALLQDRMLTCAGLASISKCSARDSGSMCARAGGSSLHSAPNSLYRRCSL